MTYPSLPNANVGMKTGKPAPDIRRLTYSGSEVIRISSFEDGLTARLEDCPRCNKTHEHLGWAKLRKPIAMDGGAARFYARCPDYGEPLLFWLREVR